MKKIRTVIALCVGMFLPVWAHAEINQVNVKKVEKDLYQTSDGTYIQTNACYADANGNDAVLKFEKYACDNNLRFDPKTICEVIDVFK